MALLVRGLTQPSTAPLKVVRVSPDEASGTRHTVRSMGEMMAEEKTRKECRWVFVPDLRTRALLLFLADPERCDCWLSLSIPSAEFGSVRPPIKYLV